MARCGAPGGMLGATACDAGYAGGDAGAGVADRIVSATDYIYMGDTNTRDSFIKIQIRCTAAATVNNAGSVMQVLRGD